MEGIGWLTMASTVGARAIEHMSEPSAHWSGAITLPT